MEGKFHHTQPVAAVLGMLTALSIGSSDLFGRRVVAASSAITAGATLHFFSVIFLLAVALATGSSFESNGFAWGGVSGIGLAIGIGCYYTGLTGSTATVVAPIVAALSSLLPFTYTVIRGSEVSMAQVIGALAVVSGLVFVTGGSPSMSHLKGGLLWGGLSGLGYSLGAIGFVEAADSEGWWPTVGQRAAALVLLFVVAAIMGVRPLPPSGQWGNGVMTGAITAITSLLYLSSLSIDPTIGVVAISAFPVFSVMIGRWFFGDQVRPGQAVGIGLVVAGVAAVSVG